MPSKDKRMKKNLFVFLIVCMLCVALMACAGTPSTPNEGQSNQNTDVVTPQPDDGNSDVASEDEIQWPQDNVRNWYEVFVYSFFDTNNDGVGDLKGVTQKLDYIKDMGFSGIWLMPIHPSPTYHKYDVTDYYAVDSAYGSLADLDELVAGAHERGIKVILDLVVNHTSDSHPWFRAACDYIRSTGHVGGEYGEYYNFVTGNATGYSPVSGTSYYYESRFWSGMPDLNLDSTVVRDKITDIMRYWMVDHGVDGFRLDAVTSYYTGEVDKNVAFLKWLNDTAKSIKEDCYIVGEAWLGSDSAINAYYNSGADSFFLFTGAQGTGELASDVKTESGAAFGEWLLSLQNTYTSGYLAPFLGNHDTMRPASFMPGEAATKMAGGLLSMMNGDIFVYYGEEIGMLSKDGANSDPRKRIAMKWSNRSMYEGLCYTTPEGIKVNADSYRYDGVAEQLQDPDSILSYYKQAMYVRNLYPAISRGTVEYFGEGQSNYVCVLRKTYGEESITIVINLDSEWEQQVTLPAQLGSLALKQTLLTDNSQKVTLANGVLTMPAYSIAILR